MWLTYFYYYMGIGVVVLATYRARQVWKPRHVCFPTFPSLEENPPSWKRRLFDAIVGPIAILLIFVPLWPLLLSIEFGFPWHRLKFWREEAEKDVISTWPDSEPGFEVSAADLQVKLSRANIEAAEMVDDPFHAVPDKPFGHLHGVWQAFVEDLEPECELWSFRGRWKTQYRDWQMQGYVALYGEEIGPYFLTSQKSMSVP